MALILLGKPNVGKSSLFNRLIQKRRALVVDRPGVTLDRIVDFWRKEDAEIEIWDLAGIQKGLRVLQQDWKAKIQGILFVVDASQSLTHEDREALNWARTLNKPILLILNKADKRSFEDHQWEALSLPAEQHFKISAEAKEGFLELEEYCFQRFSSKENPVTNLRVLIFGRPNVGKSSLLNRLSGTHMSIVSAVPGTTRDMVEAEISFKNQRIQLVDTAGIRRKSRIYDREDVVEIFSSKKAMNELKRADVCLFMVEASPDGMLMTQDRKLLRLLTKAHRPSLVLVNKWDQVKNSRRRASTFVREIQAELKEQHHLPILLISAKTGHGMKNLLEEILILKSRQRKLSTSQLNSWLERLKSTRTPRIAKAGSKEGKKKTQTQYLNYLYITQTHEDPMRFVIFTNAPSQVPGDEKKFLENRLREDFGLAGLPVQVFFRKKT
jgi:GTP-binding protein